MADSLTALMKQGVIDTETLNHLKGILQDLIEKMKITTMIGKYIEEELNKKYDAKIAIPHENNFKNGTRTIQVNTKRRRFFFFKLKRTRNDYICTISVNFDKVEIRGPTYPEHYGHFLSEDPKFMDNISGFVAGCINRMKEYPCLHYDVERDGYKDYEEMSSKRVKVLNIPINLA